jgi:hypothetical protein
LLAVLSIVTTVCAQPAPEADGPPVDVSSEAPEHKPSEVLAARRLAQGDVEWIAGKTGWRTVSVPALETRTARELAIMFFGAAEGFEGMTPLALYGREVRILYLSNRLTFDNLIDQSILLHELVHHMQVINAAPIECREAQEALAYRLQVVWLREHGVADPYALLGIAQSDIDGLTCP